MLSKIEQIFTNSWHFSSTQFVFLDIFVLIKYLRLYVGLHTLHFLIEIYTLVYFIMLILFFDSCITILFIIVILLKIYSYFLFPCSKILNLSRSFIILRVYYIRKLFTRNPCSYPYVNHFIFLFFIWNSRTFAAAPFWVITRISKTTRTLVWIHHSLGFLD